MSLNEEEFRSQGDALWREHDELQRLIEERCRKAEADWRASHPWLAPDMCVTARCGDWTYPKESARSL
jgi:hypothetical protein